jgi:hypothetical protein
VTGRVTGPNGQGLAGTSIAVDGHPVALTDSDGRYQLSLMAGEYRLSASRPCYVLTPAQIDVVVPPGAAGVDFAGALALACPYLPLILVPPLPTPIPTPTLTCTPSRTPTRTLTPTRTPTPTLTPRPWVVVAAQDFEGSFPGTWGVYDTTNTGFSWGQRTCKSVGWGNGGWAAGGGRLGEVLGCGNRYVDNAETWLLYGPFSLADATAADVQLDLWLNTEYRYDVVAVAASVGQTFYGLQWSGNSGGWIRRRVDLGALPQLGSVLGRPQVWVAVVFASDYEGNLPEGAYVDNIVVRKCVGGGCPLAASSAPAVAGLSESGWQSASPLP